MFAKSLLPSAVAVALAATLIVAAPQAAYAQEASPAPTNASQGEAAATTATPKPAPAASTPAASSPAVAVEAKGQADIKATVAKTAPLRATAVSAPMPVAPLAPSSTAGLGLKANSSSPTAIDTSSRTAVQQAFQDSYFTNDRLAMMSNNSDPSRCITGQPNPTGVEGVISSLNFMRALNGIDPVMVDVNSTLSGYAQAAATTQAASGNLSHTPANEPSFKCVTPQADTGSRISNLSSSQGQTPAQIIQWFMMDWSYPNNPFNDRLGHRMALLDPLLRQSAVGSAGGYTAVTVNTRTGFKDFDASLMRNDNATQPEVITWPAAGYFPAQLLTSMKSSTDKERWSFSSKGNLDKVGVTVRNSAGTAIPVEVIRPGQAGVQYTPGRWSGYNTVLIKIDPAQIHIPTGLSEAVYTVTVSGVTGAPKSTYSYQVRLFDGLTPSSATKPQVIIDHDAVVARNVASLPVTAKVLASPIAKLQWQRSTDKGTTWVNLPGETGMQLRPTTPSGDYQFTTANTENLKFRVVAFNSAGTTASEPISALLQSDSGVPAISVKAGGSVTISAKAAFDGNGQWVKVSHYWRVRNSEGCYPDTMKCVRVDEDITAGDQYWSVDGENLTLKKAPTTMYGETTNKLSVVHHTGTFVASFEGWSTVPTWATYAQISVQ